MIKMFIALLVVLASFVPAFAGQKYTISVCMTLSLENALICKKSIFDNMDGKVFIVKDKDERYYTYLDIFDNKDDAKLKINRASNYVKQQKPYVKEISTEIVELYSKKKAFIDLNEVPKKSRVQEVFVMKEKEQEEKRKYPEILQKITLYLEAGLTVRAAVNKIAEDYEQTRKKGAKEQAAYEELLIAVREIRMGVSEGAAYEKFGKRTGVREYIRLSTFLTQNVKKGSTMLLQQLHEEAKEAEELRMRNARKLCEEASTKLLLPMIMLLLVVMILIMFPAFSNVGV